MPIITPKITITVSTRRFIRQLFLFLLAAELLIVAGDIFLYQLEWLPWSSLRIPFNITREDTIVNCFSSLQTFVTGLVLLAIYFLAKRGRKKGAWGWAVLSAFFIFMAIDDGSKLHERMGSAFQEGADALTITARLAAAFPSYYWQVVLGPFLIAITIFMAIFLWQQFKTKTRYYWIIAAVCLLAIAVALDFLEGTNTGIFRIQEVKHNAKLLEEFLEMLGNTVFLLAFLKELIDRNKKLLLHFKK